jgi:oxygen-independent coproporphyrinogen III oxidase
VTRLSGNGLPPTLVSASGIYVHLPYCVSRCEYCSFVVLTDDSSRDSYLAALEGEAALVAAEAQGAAFDTVYFGGGTPSRIPPADLARLNAALAGRFRLLPGAEVTLEANPDDVAPVLVAAWKEAGVNRVSLGVQSFSDRELAAVGRRHDSRAARAALETLLAAGLSVSGDLILGLPEQTRDSFARSARELAGSGVDHVSVYLLETEKSRVIEEDRRLRPERYLSDDAQADLWLELAGTLARAGLAHYEISNWARPGREARHNLKYWRREPTLGLGVSAHELWDGRRRANVSALAAYLDAIRKGSRPTALDQPIGAEAAAREKLMLGLRLSAGVPRSELESLVAGSQDSRLPEDYRAWHEEGVLEERDGRVLFSERGFLLSNEVLCRFV